MIPEDRFGVPVVFVLIFVFLLNILHFEKQDFHFESVFHRDRNGRQKWGRVGTNLV